MDKKIAIFHNSLDNIGGAEIVDLILAREINADIYTTNINKLINAIITLSKNPKKYRRECEQQAKKFDTKVFIKNLKMLIEK